jgi:16S rRNA (cytosine967-C5)-methyltransferase
MNPRETALLVLQEIDTKGCKSEEALHRLLSQVAGRPDRALATELVNGSVKYRLQTDFILKRFYHHDFDKAAPVLRNILRLGVYQLLHLDRIPRSAAVNECVKLARKYKGEHLSRLVNGLLRNIAPENVHLEEWIMRYPPAEQLSIRHSHPLWLVERWLEQYGPERTESMLRYDNRPPLAGFRINMLKTDPLTLFSRPPFPETPWRESGLPSFFFAHDFARLEPLLKEGVVSVQNPTQGLACLLMDPEPGSTLYDMCAAPGGKATFMAELMNNCGRVIALDRAAKKNRLVAANARALGITIIDVREGDARSFDPGYPPDCILLDAPCTGSGVLGRRADLRWRTGKERLRELTLLQTELLDRAAALLKQGGILVYATCSVEPEENALQIDAFLRRHPEFRPDPCPESVPEQYMRQTGIEGSILTLQGEYEGFDGGFAQRLRKEGV